MRRVQYKLGPPLSSAQTELINRVYYEDKVMLGRDKLWDFIRREHPAARISRRQVMDWLRMQESWQMRLRPVAPRTIRTTVSKQPGNTLGVDLADMQLIASGGFKYILHAIDLFSRFTYARPLQNKKDTTVASAMADIIARDMAAPPRAIRSDRGSEFVSGQWKALMDRHGITHVLTEPGRPQSNGQIERANSTLKGVIRRAREVDPHFKWPAELPKLLHGINNSRSTGVRAAPAEIMKRVGEKEFIAANRKAQVARLARRRVAQARLFDAGDTVRIRIEDDKDPGRYWSNRLYEVWRVYEPRNDYGVHLYQVRDGGETFQTLFKGEQLQRFHGMQTRVEAPEMWRISKLVRPTTDNNAQQYVVRWVNYTDTTTEPRGVLIEDVPKLVEAFEKLHAVKWTRDTRGRVKVDWNETPLPNRRK